MIKATEILTYVRAARFDNPLEEAVKGFSEELTNVTTGLGNTVKYSFFKKSDEPYLLMVSQQKDRVPNAAGYNVLVTVTSFSDLLDQHIAEKFQREIGILLNISVPESIKKHFELMNLSFPVFLDNPEAAMAALKGY